MGWPLSKRVLVFAVAMAIASPALAQPVQHTDPAAAIKSLLSTELSQVERDLAQRMIRRTATNLDPIQRGYLELGIDLRVIQRAILSSAIDAGAFTNEQAILWHRARQLHAAIHGLEDALAQAGWAAPGASQQQAMVALRKLSFDIPIHKDDTGRMNDSKSATGQHLDGFFRNLAVAMANCVNATPVEPAAIPSMRPTPLAREDTAPKSTAPTVAELADQVQKSAALSSPLRQHLLALVKDANEEKGRGPAYQMLNQVATLARGLQGHTAITPDQRAAIEAQVTEGLALFMDPRTRDAGKARVEALSQYRQVLSRIAKLSLSRDQLEQLAPALTWAQSAGEPGTKFLATLEKYFELCGKWDALASAASAPVPPLTRRAYDDLAAQFAKERVAFWNDAVKIGTGTASGSQVVATDLEARLAELNRMHAVADDLLALTKSFDTLNAYKPRPTGALEKKAQIAANAAASSSPSILRNDGERFLKAVRRLADLSQRLSSQSQVEVSSPALQSWAGGKLESFEARCKGLVLEQVQALAAGSVDPDPARASRLETALTMAEALRAAAKLEASLARADVLSRWADWGVDPASLGVVLAPYKESTSAAFATFGSDQGEPVERWKKMHTRYLPLVALINRDAAYADQCEKMPIGFAADVARLATPMESAPFATERFASCATSACAALERSDDPIAADRAAVILAKRLAQDLGLSTTIEEPVTRPRKTKN
jgi:hypothetical protein